MSNGTVLLERERVANDYTLQAIALSSILIIGTGSATNVPVSVNGTFLCAPVRDLINDSIPLVATSLRSLLHDARSNFEISAVELASILGVSRQTLYDWSAERAEPRIDKQRRLREVSTLSAQWRITIGTDIETVNRKFSDKPELIAILSDISLSTAEKSDRLALLARQRREIAGLPSVSDRLQALGFRRDEKLQRRVLDDQGW